MSESNDLVFHNQKLSPMNNASRRELPSSIPITVFSINGNFYSIIV